MMLQANAHEVESNAALTNTAQNTVRENLAAWHGDMQLGGELSLLQIEAIAEEMRRKAADVEGCRHMAQALLGGELSPSHTTRAQQLAERFALCRKLADLPFSIADQEQPSQKAQPSHSEECSIAILSSPIFSAAVTAFSPAVPGAQPFVRHSFTEICEAVAAGRARFGILPLEDTAEGKLFRLYEQIERYELHIACTADIKEDGNKTVRMALLYKSEPPSIIPEGERVLECLLFGESEHALTDLLTAACAFGLSLRRVDSQPLSYKEDSFVQHLVLPDRHGNVHAFLTYLSLFMPRTAITADYINIKTRELS